MDKLNAAVTLAEVELALATVNSGLELNDAVAVAGSTLAVDAPFPVVEISLDDSPSGVDDTVA
jgi:hypothetical protein